MANIAHHTQNAPLSQTTQRRLHCCHSCLRLCPYILVAPRQVAQVETYQPWSILEVPLHCSIESISKHMDQYLMAIMDVPTAEAGV